MSRSLRRALVVRFAASMGIGLVVVAADVPSGGVRLECELVGATQGRHAA